MGLLDFLRFHPAPVPLREPVAARKALSDAAVPVSRDWTYNWGWQDAAGGVGLIGGYAGSYAEMYRRQIWVYAAVNTLARGIAAMPFKLYLREGDARKRDRDSPLARLFANPYDRLTTFQFFEKLVSNMCIYGNAIAIKGLYRDGAPSILTPLSPRNFTIDGGGDYRYREPATGKETVFRRERVYHAAFYNPDDETLGVSPLEPLRYTLAIEDAAQRLGVAAFKNGGNRPGTLSTDQDLKPEDQKRLSAEYNARHGGVDNAYKTPVLFGGLKWQPTGGTMAESAVVDHRKLTREEVAAAFHVPPPVIGILDHATFANITEQNRMLVQHAFRPWAGLFEETLRLQVFADFGDADRRYGEFDFRDMLKGTPLDQFSAYSQALNAGWLTQNEVRELENLPRVADEDADRLHRPLNLTPAPPEAAPPTGVPSGQ